MTGLRCGSLFSGVGLFELGLVWSGLVSEMAWQVEIDPWCRSVLAARYPGADRSVSDVSLAGSSNLASVDLICGGFPCQDVSGAGLGAGLGGARSGLWYQFRRIVEELRPPLVIVENVASGKGRWLCAVRSGLHALGYRTRAVQVSAADVGLPHRRERIFVVAYAERQGEPQPQRAVPDERRWAEHGGYVAYADGERCLRRTSLFAAEGSERIPELERDHTGRPALPLLGRGPHGLPDRVDRAPAGRGAEQHEWEPARTALRVPQRQARLKALGNGIVPQCAEAVGRFVTAEILPPMVRS